MRAFLAAFALTLGLIAVAASAEDKRAGAAAGSPYGDLQQVELNQDQIANYIDALGDMSAAMGDAPADAAEPDDKTMTKLEGIAKKHGFKDFDDYNNVAGNIALVLDGVDPDSKAYVGSEKMIERAIAELKSDKQMSQADRRSALADLEARRKSATQVKYKANIDLVLKNYDKLSAD